MLWLNEREEKIRDLGWLVGFFEGEGCLHTSKRKYKTFAIVVAQQERESLDKCKGILKEHNIDVTITKQKHCSSRTGCMYYLSIRYNSMSKFLEILEHSWLSKKRDEQFKKFKKAWNEYLNRNEIKDIENIKHIISEEEFQKGTQKE